MWADPATAPTATAAPANTLEIVDRYLSAVQTQQKNPVSAAMEVDIDAKLPRLKKQGRLHALKFITKVGQILYPPNWQRYEGDNTVKKEVIARYLQAEQQARSEYSSSMAITPANYKFKYKGITDYAGRPAYVLQLTPRSKRLGLFKGELWIDQQTSLPLREWGELVKNPSVFLKSVYFVRDYYICGGISVPRRLISDVDTRLVGKAQLTIWFDKYRLGDSAVAAEAALGRSPQIAQAAGSAKR
jgi:hypothetical protein